MDCTACSARLPRGAAFCPACGNRCAPQAARDERKLATVLFCDLVGSTTLSGLLDPEALRTVTLRYFTLMRAAVETHGGTVEKFIGDAVMAVFGVPTMREDDARRALSAALDMRTALRCLNEELARGPGVRLDVRIGVNTGEVVATSDPTARQALLSGEVVNVAARLEQHAPSGGILCGEDTVLAAGPAAVCEDVGPLALKGKAAPVHAYRLTAVRDDVPHRQRRVDLDFVGREPEKAELDLHAARIANRRQSHLVTLYGEAGIGKTRLVHEWLSRRAPDGAPSASATGRCSSYGTSGSLAPLAEALRGLPGGLRPPDGLSDAEREQFHLVADVLRTGLLRDGSPGVSTVSTAAAVGRLLALLSSRGLVTLVIDDCQWATHVLLDVLETVLDHTCDAAVLLLCAARPELLERRPGWGSALRASSMLLTGLGNDDARRFAAAVRAAAGGRDGAEVLAHGGPGTPELLERAGGNPLHLEQLLLSVGEEDPGPTACSGVPPTLRAVLGSRVDALDAPERTVLEAASVLGREFRTDELGPLLADDPPLPSADVAAPAHEGESSATVPADVADGAPDIGAALHRLTGRRLVEPVRDTAPTPDGAPKVFRFAGALVQEVVYAGTSRRRRAEWHERAATLPGADDAGTGRHLARAHAHLRELALFDTRSERLRVAACTRLGRAGADAFARSDLPWAEELLRDAHRLSRTGDDGHARLTRLLGDVLVALGRIPEGTALLRDVADDARSGCAVETAYARLSLAVLEPDGPHGRPVRAARAAMPLFEAAGETAGLAGAGVRMAQDAQFRGRHRSAVALLRRALERAARARAEPERAMAAGALGVSLWQGPLPVPRGLDACRALLDDHAEGRPAVRLTLTCSLAVLLALRGDHRGATEALSRAGRTARALGYAEADAWLPLFAATVASSSGRPDEALRWLTASEDACRHLGLEPPLRTLVLERARVLLDTGKDAGELPESDAGCSAAEKAELHGLRARVRAEEGREREALALAASAVRSADVTDSPVVRAVARTDAARVHLALGRPREAAAAARRAEALFTAKGHLPGAASARRLAAGHAFHVGGPRPGPPSRYSRSSPSPEV